MSLKGGHLSLPWVWLWEEEYIIIQYGKQKKLHMFFSFLLFEPVFHKKMFEIKCEMKIWC